MAVSCKSTLNRKVIPTVLATTLLWLGWALLASDFVCAAGQPDGETLPVAQPPAAEAIDAEPPPAGAAAQPVQPVAPALDADVAQPPAVDQLDRSWWMAAWDAVSSIWTYELTSADGQSVTIQKIVSALLLILVGLLFSRILSRWLGRQLLRRLELDPSATATMQALVYYTLIVFFVLLALKVVQVPLTAFTFVGGAIALGVGFGSQNILNNFISGLILLAERPVKVGDLIQLGDLYGNIEHIGARSTRVRTGGDLEIIVPNSSFLQDNVINFTLSSDKVRSSVQVGVAYGSPTGEVAALLKEAAQQTARVAKDPSPIVLFTEFGESALTFEVHFWIRIRTMMERRQIESAVRFRIDELFRDHGITISFPQRDVHLHAAAPLPIRLVESSPSPTVEAE